MIHFDFSGVVGQFGIAADWMSAGSFAAASAHDQVLKERNGNKVGYFHLPHDREALQTCATVAQNLKHQGVRVLIVVGIGG